MEEQRIGRMYLNLFTKWLDGLWGRLFPSGFRRSSALPVIAIVVLIGVPIIAWKLHRAGRFGFIKRQIAGQPQTGGDTGPRPGGMHPMVLKRDQTPGGNVPEFLSVTMLPGLGMDILQITALVPNKGEVALLTGPSVQNLADGTTPTRIGFNDRWGAIELPWSGIITGLLTPVGTSVRTTWRGNTIEAPNDMPGRIYSEGGMLTALSADATQMTPEESPTTASAIFKGVDFDQHWPARNDISVSVTLGSHTLDLTVLAKNVGDQPEPMGMGWHPRFLIPSGNRNAVEILLPGGQQLEVPDHSKQIPSGKMESPGAAIGRFQQRPWVVGPESVDASLVHLKPGVMSTTTSAEIRDPQSEFGLRMTALNDATRELRLTSPDNADWVGLGMQTNFDDPFGKEWTTTEPAIQTLLPGQTAQWKIRLEIFAVSSRAPAR